LFFFFFNDTATTEIYTLSLHDALPIYFDDPTYNRKLAAAARLAGPRRYAAYQALETDLLRNAAPAAPLYNVAESEFFSARIGCQVYQPIYQIDLAALCLKQRR